MPVIKPISDLRSYNTVLNDVEFGTPVFLTKNGRGRYVLMDIDEYEKNQASLALLSALAEGEISAKVQGCLSIDEAERRLGLK
ncbi:MAG: type II toxin-antitoxin system Phd/YefM family antitoxin [Selenomonadaceae bacterium]|nr:type II toxin-antitoxin system Phd/YefM family antitoxin [Selenomonadaceae bacterium]